MQTISMPFNIEENNNNTFAYTIGLAKKYNAHVVVYSAFNVIRNPEDSEESYSKRIRKRWYEAFWHYTDLKSHYLKTHTDEEKKFELKFSFEFVHGKFKDGFFNILKEKNIDCVVAGLNTFERDDYLLTNTLVKEISEKTQIPLFIIPANCPYITVSNIVYTTDFNKLEGSLTIFDQANELAELYHANVHYLHIAKNQKAILKIEDSKLLKTISDRAQTRANYHFDVIESGDVPAGLKNYANSLKIDLIIAIRQEKTRFEKLLHGSFTNKIGFSSQVPVLLFHETIGTNNIKSQPKERKLQYA